MSEQLDLLPGFLLAHARLSVFALLVGAAISVPLGIWAASRGRTGDALVSVSGVIQTIPGLAMLALMVPLLALVSAASESALGISFRSIGVLPVSIALVLYSSLPILRNTVTGLRGIDPAVVEAGIACGMTKRQLLWRVQLPIAAPIIMAGLRTAAVWVVGLATLSTPVGATSLGNFIFTGLQTRNFTAVSVGCVAAALFALLVDASLKGAGVLLQKRRPRPVVAGALLIVALLSFFGSTTKPDTVRIGAKPLSESLILAKAIKNLVGGEAKVLPAMGTHVAFEALRTSEIDFYVDYSGTLWKAVRKREDPAPRATVVAQLKTWLQKEHGIRLVAPLGFENTYAIVIQEKQATRLAIDKISDLHRWPQPLRFGADYEFFDRPEWKALRAAYSLNTSEQRTMDPSLMLEAVASGEVDAAAAYSTDGRLDALNLVLLEDDQQAIPPYDALILASPEASTKHVRALQRLENRITAEQMRTLNRRVDQEGESPNAVARSLLQSLGF